MYQPVDNYQSAKVIMTSFQDEYHQPINFGFQSRRKGAINKSILIQNSIPISNALSIYSTTDSFCVIIFTISFYQIWLFCGFCTKVSYVLELYLMQIFMLNSNRSSDIFWFSPFFGDIFFYCFFSCKTEQVRIS